MGLLSDTEAGLHMADWNGNAAQDIQLVSMLPNALKALPQGNAGAGTQPLAGIVVNGKTYYFGESYCAGTAVVAAYPATRICPTTNGGDSNFVIPLTYGPLSNGPGGAALVPTAFPAAASFTTANNSTNGLEWPINNGWLLVEVKWAADGLWHGVTSEWLGLGFARGLQVPTSPGTPHRALAA